MSVCDCRLSYSSCNAHASHFIVTCDLSGSTIFFSKKSHKRHHFRGGKITEHKMCIFNFPINLSEIFLILRRIQQGIIINVHRF